MTDRPAFATRAAAACLIAAPLCEVVEAVLSPLRGTSTAADLVGIAGNETRFVVSVLIGLLGTCLYVPAFLGLLNRCDARSPRLSMTARVLVVASMLGFAGIRMGQAVELQTIREGVPSTTAVRVIDGVTSNPIGATLLVMFLGGTVVGVILLAIALWRSGEFARTPALLLLLFPFADLALTGKAGTIASHCLLLVALAWLAVRPRTAQARIAPPIAAA